MLQCKVRNMHTAYHFLSMHLRRDPVEYGQVGSAHLFDLSFSQVGRCIQVRACLPRVRVQTMRARVRACVRASTRVRESTV